MIELRAVGHRLPDQRDRVLDRHPRNFVLLAGEAAAVDPAVRRPGRLDSIVAIYEAVLLSGR